VEDPAIDLAVVAAVLSSNQDSPVDSKTCFAAEVGLSGEIRPINRVEQRISEADKLGFARIFISGYNTKGLDFKRYSIQIIPVTKIEEVYRKLFP
jgi:DNA repair protein RadA/Sms